VLGEGSKEGYDIYLEDIRVALGNEVVTAFTPVNAQAAMDAYKGRPGAARYFRAVLSWLANQILVAFAVTYLVGVIVTAWFLAQIGPRIPLDSRGLLPW
jgi:hypothetical protein